jgi:hypothetical protein
MTCTAFKSNLVNSFATLLQCTSEIASLWSVIRRQITKIEGIYVQDFCFVLHPLKGRMFCLEVGSVHCEAYIHCRVRLLGKLVDSLLDYRANIFS